MSRSPLAASVLVVLAGAARGSEDAWRSAPSSAGAEDCADCHAAIVEDWSRTAMARALGPLEPGELEGLAAVSEPGSPFAYRLDAEGGAPRVVETSSDREDFVRRAPLLFAIGAGDRDRAFAAGWGAFMAFAPVEVVRHGTSRDTVLAPVHAQTPGLRLDVPITDECLGCHTDALPPERFPLHLAPDPASWTPRGISCAGCHGNATEHVTFRESDQSEIESEPLVPLARLDRVGRMSVCAACHLQGDARIVLGDERQGPPPPGGDLLDLRALFVAAEPNDDIGFVSQVDRLVRSACYTESRALDCTSCHDPHRHLGDAAERRRTRGSCVKCHAEGGRVATLEPATACTEENRPEARDCVDCHMRRTPVFDVGEVEIHDHFVQRRPGPPSRFEGVRSLEAPDGNWRRFRWPGEPPPEHVDDPGLELMAFYSRGFPERARQRLDDEPGAAAAELPSYWHARGALLERAEDLEPAAEAYRRALELAPGYGPSAVNLGAVLALSGDLDGARVVLDEHLRRHPRSPGGLRNRALVRLDQGDVRGFVEDLTAAFDLTPTAAGARDLADIWRQLGSEENAKAYDAIAGRL